MCKFREIFLNLGKFLAFFEEIVYNRVDNAVLPGVWQEYDHYTLFQKQKQGVLKLFLNKNKKFAKGNRQSERNL